MALWIADHETRLMQIYEDLRSAGLLGRIAFGDFAEIMCVCSIVPGAPLLARHPAPLPFCLDFAEPAIADDEGDDGIEYIEDA